MKKLFSIALFALSAAAFTTGCKTTTTVSNGQTNTVTTIDPAKLAQVQAVVEPAAASVLRRAILNSPQHAQQIGNYARAVGTVFCTVQGAQSFTPLDVMKAMDQATQGLQANAPAEAIDAKNAAVALYTILWNDKLRVEVPNNGWPNAVCSTFCNSIDLALKDAGQPGIK